MTPLEMLQSLRMPFAVTMGVEFVEAGLDRVVATLPVRADLCTILNTLHGGAMMALADSVGAAGALINLPDGKKTTTIESKTNFVSAVPVGTTVKAIATPVHKGRTTQVWQTRIETDDGRLVAVVTQTQHVF